MLFRSKVRIKGETDVLNKVAKIAIPDDVLDMSGATEDVETTVDITSYLPDRDVYKRQEVTFQQMIRNTSQQKRYSGLCDRLKEN